MTYNDLSMAILATASILVFGLGWGVLLLLVLVAYMIGRVTHSALKRLKSKEKIAVFLVVLWLLILI